MARGFKILIVAVVGWYAVTSLLSFVTVPISGFQDAIHYMLFTIPCALLYVPLLASWVISAAMFEAAHWSRRDMNGLCGFFIGATGIATAFTVMLTFVGGIAAIIIGNGSGHGDTRVINMGCYVIAISVLMGAITVVGGAYGLVRAESYPGE